MVATLPCSPLPRALAHAARPALLLRRSAQPQPHHVARSSPAEAAAADLATPTCPTSTAADAKQQAPPPPQQQKGVDEQERCKALLKEAVELPDPRAALERLQALQREHPANSHFALAAAGLHEKLGAHTAAEAAYSAAAAAAGSTGAEASIALQRWGVYEAGRGRADAARELLRRAIAADPKHGAAYNALGRLEERAGNSNEALRLYEAGFVADPGHVHSLVSRAVLEARLGRSKEADRLFK